MLFTPEQLSEGSYLIAHNLPSIVKEVDAIILNGVPSDTVSIIPAVPVDLLACLTPESLQSLLIATDPDRGYYPVLILHGIPPHLPGSIISPNELRYPTRNEAGHGALRLLYNVMLYIAGHNGPEHATERPDPFMLFGYHIHIDLRLTELAPLIAETLGVDLDSAISRIENALSRIMAGARQFHPRMFDSAPPDDRMALVSAILGLMSAGIRSYEPRETRP